MSFELTRKADSQQEAASKDQIEGHLSIGASKKRRGLPLAHCRR